jgi:Arc/MetJ-type ribon-helix-helix transcriptional regulator
VNLPPNLAKELEELVKETGYWLSVVDFMREGTVEKLERWKRDHPKP